MKRFGASTEPANSFDQTEAAQIAAADRHQSGTRLSPPQRSRTGFTRGACRTTAPDRLVQEETPQKIRQAFRRLTAKLQVTATLALAEEQPYDEIADALGI